MIFLYRAKLVILSQPKTGTTAVQSSLFVRQAELAAYGVAYPGRRRHERAAVSAVALEWSPPGFRGDLDRDWRWLTHEVLASPADRVVVSSELFAVAPDARLPRIVGDLGGGPGGDLKVVITIRPPARMLPSQWQELVQNLETLDYEAWLRRLFASDTAPETATAVASRASRARNREEITSLPCPGPTACRTPYRNAIQATASAGPVTSPWRSRRSSRERAWFSWRCTAFT